jgi:tRNA (mo5U34)-methyltransferase
MEIAPGVVTPGWFDLRELPSGLPMPSRLDGQRCLDVGTFDGFWAFEMERRGAAEVIAIDVLDPTRWDWPVGSSPTAVEAIGRRKAGGDGFLVAKAARGSRVERREISVYDLDPDAVGRFDFVYVGSLLLHLRDPVLALERIAAVCRGAVLVVDAIDLPLSRLFPRRPLAGLDGRGRPWWWKPNAAGLARMVVAAGLDVEAGPQRLAMKPGPGFPVPRVRLRHLRSFDGWQTWATARHGEPHAAVLARPRPG